MLYKASRQNYLKHITSQTMLYTTAYVGTMLIIGQWRSALANSLKTEVLLGRIVYCFQQIFKSLLATKRCKGQSTVEVVYHNHVPIHYIQYVGSVVFGLSLVLNIDVLKVAHGIERCVTKESEHFSIVAFYLKTRHKGIYCTIAGIIIVYVVLLDYTSWQSQGCHSVCYRYTSERMRSYKRATALSVVIVGTFHKRTLHTLISKAHVQRYGGVNVGKNVLRHCCIFQFRIFHILLPFLCC